jgi:hypothetical protein
MGKPRRPGCLACKRGKRARQAQDDAYCPEFALADAALAVVDAACGRSQPVKNVARKAAAERGGGCIACVRGALALLVAHPRVVYDPLRGRVSAFPGYSVAQPGTKGTLDLLKRLPGGLHTRSAAASGVSLTTLAALRDRGLAYEARLAGGVSEGPKRVGSAWFAGGPRVPPLGQAAREVLHMHIQAAAASGGAARDSRM